MKKELKISIYKKNRNNNLSSIRNIGFYNIIIYNIKNNLKNIY
jgi:hypothetical protein